jgi:hypothetical protein
MNDHWQTIEDALIDKWDAAVVENDDKEMDASGAALAFVREQRAQAALLAPDSPGFWAWEGYFNFGDDDVDPNDIQQRLCEVRQFGDTLCAIATRGGAYSPKCMVGKWYRLTMPWEQRPQPKEGAA